MPKPSRRFLFLSLAAAVFGAAVMVWALWPRTAITRYNAARVEKGMTVAEVEAIMGGPARNETIDSASWLVTPVRSTVWVWDNRDPAVAFSRSWIGSSCAVLVAFDHTERAVQVRVTDVVPADDGLFNRIRGRLGL